MLIYILGLIGVIVFAASGALSAVRKEFDLMGVTVISIVTALGGGTLRDILLDRNPIFWVGDPIFICTALLGAYGTLIYVRFWHPPDNALLIADALGMALFSIAGTQLSQGLGHGGVIAVLMGAITGAAGGVIRDVLSTEVPLLFRKTETLYATTAIIGCSCYLLLDKLNLGEATSSLLSVMSIIILRLGAIFLGLHLPFFTVFHQKGKS
jgi:uncharacterized membrane protein YeiH